MPYGDRSKETVYEFPEESLLEEQEMRRIGDPNDDLIIEWYFTKIGDTEREQGITTRQVWLHAVNGGVTYGKGMDKLDEMRLGNTLHSQLHLERRRTRGSGGLLYRYYPTEETNKVAPPDMKVQTDIFTKEVQDF